VQKTRQKHGAEKTAVNQRIEQTMPITTVRTTRRMRNEYFVCFVRLFCGFALFFSTGMGNEIILECG